MRPISGAPSARSSDGDAAAREVDRGLGERLVERRARGAEAAHAGAVAERDVERLAERDRAVLDGVVLVDPEVAGAAQLEIGERPEREAREHVVEKPEAGRDARAAAAQQAEPHVDARLARRAPHLGDALAAHAVVGFGRLAAGELGERAQQARVGRAVRDRDAEAVGQQRLVPERAHGAAALGQPREDVGHRRAREHEVAGVGQHLDARAAHARGQPAALLDDRAAARLQLVGLAAGQLGDGRRPGRDRAGRA